MYNFEVELKYKLNGTTFCEGSIVNALLILTTAQCVINRKVNNYGVAAGTGSNDPLLLQARNVRRVIIHEDYKADFLLYNIALLELELPLRFDPEGAQRVQLPQDRTQVPSLATANGWGLLLHGWTRDVDKKPRIPITLASNGCRDRNCSTGRSSPLEEMRCEGSSSSGLCRGYAGGTIMCRPRDESEYDYLPLITNADVQCGINAFPFGTGGLEDYPNVYMEVAYFITWIREKMSCICGTIDQDVVCEESVDGKDSCIGGGNPCTQFELLCDDVPGGRCVPDGRLGVRYRSHLEGSGWQDWVSDGVTSGTEGGLRRVEAIQIQLTNRVPDIRMKYRVHVQDQGWLPFVNEGEMSGTIGLGLQLEALQIVFESSHYTLQYKAYLGRGVGWQNKTDAGPDVFVGTIRQSRPMQGFRIRITRNAKECRSKGIEPNRVVKYTFNVSYISGAPDGVHVDHILAINQKFPGPMIRVVPGDILEIKVINSIQDGQNTTIHWHGIAQAGTPFEDGPSLVTQCPIPPGSYQVYRFPVQQPGTSWYHSHVGSQYTEGLWGILAVHDLRERYSPDAEFTITLQEWYHNSAHVNERWHLSPQSEGMPPYPHSILMNGYGQYNCSEYAFKNRSCNSREQFRPIFHLKNDQVYRLRLINVGGWATYNFTIDGHTLEAIEIDGIEIDSPVKARAVHLGAGQVYSLLVRRMNSEERNREYLIRAFLRTEFLFRRQVNGVYTPNLNHNPDAVIKEVTGVIKYSSQNVNLNSTRTVNVTGVAIAVIVPAKQPFPFNRPYPKLSKLEKQNLRFLEHNNCKAMESTVAPNYVDDNHQFVINLTFSNGSDGVYRAGFNNKPFRLAFGKPLLIRTLNGEGIPSGAQHIDIAYGKVVQIVINNVRLGPHPVHLHGHHFWVVASGKGTYTEGAHAFKLDGVRRDTVMVKELSFVVIRFVADNPGVWALHCHIDWHTLSGMRIVIVEAAPLARKLFQITAETEMQCRAHGISTRRQNSTSRISKGVQVNFTVDTSRAPDLEGFGQQVKSAVEMWYPKISGYLDYPGHTSSSEMSLTFDPSCTDVAFFSRFRDNRIVACAAYFRNYLDVSPIITLVTHSIEKYGNSPGPPNWWIYGLVHYFDIYWYNQKEATRPSSRDSHIVSTDFSAAAYFIHWINTNYGKGLKPLDLIQGTHKDAREGKFNDGAFIRAKTGKTLDQLWSEMLTPDLG